MHNVPGGNKNVPVDENQKASFMQLQEQFPPELVPDSSFLGQNLDFSSIMKVPNGISTNNIDPDSSEHVYCKAGAMCSKLPCSMLCRRKALLFGARVPTCCQLGATPVQTNTQENYSGMHTCICSLYLL